ncbi:hypothetical protein C8R44DRAFT_620068, partial [Mycena epipterygia]
MGLDTDPMSSTSQLKITRLPKLKDDGSNWINYRDLAMNTLTAKGLRRHVVGTIKAPKELVVRDGAFYLPGRLAPLSDDELEEHETKLDEYLQKQAQVREVIYQTVSEATFMRIKSAPTAQLMLQQLVAIFEGKGEMVQIDTLTRLQSLRCPEDGDIILHITEMKRLKEALDSMSAPIADAHADDEAQASAAEATKPKDILIDAGATRHFSPDHSSFLNFEEIPPVPIRAADGRTFSATGRGDIKV